MEKIKVGQKVTSVYLHADTHAMWKELAKQRGEFMVDVLNRLIEREYAERQLRQEVTL